MCHQALKSSRHFLLRKKIDAILGSRTLVRFISFWMYMDTHYILWIPDSIFSHTEFTPQLSVCGKESISISALMRPEFQKNFPSSHWMSTLEVPHEQLYVFFKYSFLIQLIWFPFVFDIQLPIKSSPVSRRLDALGCKWNLSFFSPTKSMPEQYYFRISLLLEFF